MLELLYIYMKSPKCRQKDRDGSTALRVQPVILSHFPTLTDSNCTGWAEDLIAWVIVELLCCILDTNIRLYINDVSVKKRVSKKRPLASIIIENLNISFCLPDLSQFSSLESIYRKKL